MILKTLANVSLGNKKCNDFDKTLLICPFKLMTPRFQQYCQQKMSLNTNERHEFKNISKKWFLSPRNAINLTILRNMDSCHPRKVRYISENFDKKWFCWRFGLKVVIVTKECNVFDDFIKSDSCWWFGSNIFIATQICHDFDDFGKRWFMAPQEHHIFDNIGKCSYLLAPWNAMILIRHSWSARSS